MLFNFLLFFFLSNVLFRVRWHCFYLIFWMRYSSLCIREYICSLDARMTVTLAMPCTTECGRIVPMKQSVFSGRRARYLSAMSGTRRNTYVGLNGQFCCPCWTTKVGKRWIMRGECSWKCFLVSNRYSRRNSFFDK